MSGFRLGRESFQPPHPSGDLFGHGTGLRGAGRSQHPVQEIECAVQRVERGGVRIPVPLFAGGENALKRLAEGLNVRGPDRAGGAFQAVGRAEDGFVRRGTAIRLPLTAEWPVVRVLRGLLEGPTVGGGGGGSAAAAEAALQLRSGASEVSNGDILIVGG